MASVHILFQTWQNPAARNKGGIAAHGRAPPTPWRPNGRALLTSSPVSRGRIEGIGQFDLSDPFLTLEYSLPHELRNRMRRLLRRVETGERIQITVRLAARMAQVFAIQSNRGWRAAL